MKPKLSLFYFIFLIFSSFLKAEEWYNLEVKVITTGENQVQREVGTFGAEIPQNGKGHLQKKVVIRNQTRNKSNEVDFKITFQPIKTESGVIHIIFTSESTPKVGKPETKFRDLLFDSRSNQLVEIYNDLETGTHLLISISIKEKEVEKENLENIKVIFKCKVERINNDAKELIDSYDLQTIGGNPVRRVLTQKVPVLVEGDFGEVATTGFKEIDKENKPVYLKAGDGFSYTPPKKKAKERENRARKKFDSRIPLKYQKEKEEENKKLEEETYKEKEPKQTASTSINWEKEEFSYEISLLEAARGKIKSLIKLEGALFDSIEKKLKPLQSKEETQTFGNGEIATFSFLENEGDGFILTVQAFF